MTFSSKVVPCGLGPKHNVIYLPMMIKAHKVISRTQVFLPDQSLVCHKRREICEHFSLVLDNEFSQGDNGALSIQNLTETSRRKIKLFSIVPFPSWSWRRGSTFSMQIQYSSWSAKLEQSILHNLASVV